MANSWNGTEDNNDKFSNYSMSFDGSSETINLGDSDTFSFGNGSTDSPLSFSIWINLSTLSTPHCVINKQTSSSNGEYKIYILTSGKIYIELANNGGEANGARGIQSGTNLSINQWYHLTFTYDGRGGSTAYDGMNLYINGSLDSSTDWSYLSYTAMNNTNADLILGDLITGGSNTYDFQGKIDHFCIFDYALSQAQVTQLYGSSSTGVGNPMAITNGRKPVAYYPIGDYSAYNGTEYLVANSAVSDYVFDFSGSNQNINLGNDASLYPGTSDMSYSFWFKSDSFSGYKTIFLQGAANLNVLNQGDKAVFITTLGDELRVFVASNTGGFGNDSNNAFDTSNANFVVNQWYHIVFTLDRDGDAVIYINGVSNVTQAVKSSSAGVDIVDTDNSIIGGVAYDFDGQISNFQIFNTVLSSNNVETLYNNGLPYTGTQPQAANLKGWWKLDASATFDGSNFSIPDDSSNSNTGTSSGMTASNLVQSNLNILSPYSRYALDFDAASSEYIDCGNDSSLSPSNFTFSVWAKSDLSNGSWVSKFSSENYGFGIYGGVIFLNIKTSAGWGGLSLTASSYLTADKWHNIVGTYDETNLKIYVDGNLSGTLSKTGPITYSSRNTRIGNLEGTSALDFNGSLSNVSIWNAALTSTQVTEIYNNSLPSNLNNHSAYSNLISWWQLGENSSFNSNWTVIDEKGTNNGTSLNMAEDDLVNGVGTTANGLSSGMGGADNILGEAPYSNSNALSYGMGADAKSSDTPS
jgi:hypothetical protein